MITLEDRKNRRWKNLLRVIERLPENHPRRQKLQGFELSKEDIESRMAAFAEQKLIENTKI